MIDISNGARKLGSLEWNVIEMALHDGPRSVKPQGRLGKFCGTLFGLPVPRQLANAELEALRRFCVSAWFRDTIGILEVRTLLDEGYSRADVRRILAHIGSRRGFVPPVKEYPI